MPLNSTSMVNMAHGQQPGITFAAQRKELLQALAVTAPVASKKTPMPILTNVLLRCESGRLSVTATDLNVSVTAAALADLAAVGSICVSGKTIYDMVKSLPEGEVKLTASGAALELRSGKVRFKLPSMPAADYPATPQLPEQFATLSAATVGGLLKLTSYAMSLDETRPHLHALLLDCGAKMLVAVATDGHRLSHVAADVDTEPFTMLIPARGVHELERLTNLDGDDQLMVGRNNGFVFFGRAGVTVSCKLSEENYVPYAKVIPQRFSTSVEIDRSALIDAIKRIAIVAPSVNRTLRVGVNKSGLHLRAEDVERGEGSEELDADVSGPELEIGLSSLYLLNALQPLAEDRVRLEFGGALDAAAVKPVGPTNFVGVVMPVRI